MTTDDDDWIKWALWVKSNIRASIKRIDKQEKDLDDLFKLVTDVRLEQQTLKVKAGIWGLVAGFIPVCTLALIYVFQLLAKTGGVTP